MTGRSDRPGPLEGLRVVELASEHAAFAAKLMGDMGADVIVVEPPGGHHTRDHGPFADGEPGADRSLWWLTYNTSKRSVTIDLDEDPEQLRSLMAGADVVIDGEPASRRTATGLGYDSVRVANPRLIWVAVTPYGYHDPASREPFTDLTMLAGGGPVWSCGYDDHSLPPVRGLGNQAYHIASAWAVVGTLVAVLHRSVSGRGQLVDVSMHAAANVTTEVATYEHLVAGTTVRRQTARHASATPTAETMAIAADGIAVNTGVPPRTGRELAALAAWLRESGCDSTFDDIVLLDLGAEMDRLDPSTFADDALAAAIYTAGREAMVHVAEHMPAGEFFHEAQRRGFTCGPILSPEEFLADQHLAARGFLVPVTDPALGALRHAGPPFRAPASPCAVRPAPRIGEHNQEVLLG